MTPDRRPEETRDEPQAEQRIDELERRRRELEDAISGAILAIDHGRISDAREELNEGHRCDRTSPHEAYHDDVRDLLEALDLGTHARPESPRQVVHSEVVPAIKRLRQKRKGLEAENERLKEQNDVLAKAAYDMRGALQSIADGIGNQKTAEDALHRVTSRGIADLDVAPERVGIKGRIEELEAEVERLREKLDKEWDRTCRYAKQSNHLFAALAWIANPESGRREFLGYGEDVPTARMYEQIAADAINGDALDEAEGDHE